jgi:hypothetical protein
MSEADIWLLVTLNVSSLILQREFQVPLTTRRLRARAYFAGGNLNREFAFFRAKTFLRKLTNILLLLEYISGLSVQPIYLLASSARGLPINGEEGGLWR